MSLTTVARGRVYEWSHAVGRGAASGTGFNYPQTMCLANGGVAYVAVSGAVSSVRLATSGTDSVCVNDLVVGLPQPADW